MSPSASIKGISYVSSNTYSNKPYASRRKPVSTAPRSESATRNTRSRRDSATKTSDGTFLTPRSAPLSPKSSILYREVTVIARAKHGQRRNQPSKQPIECNSSWLSIPQRSNRNSIKDNFKHLSFSSTHSEEGKAERRSQTRPSSVDKASISRPIPEEQSSRSPTPNPKKQAPQPLPLEHRSVPAPKWNSFRTFANATPPLPHRSTFMDLSPPPSPPRTRPTTSTSRSHDTRPTLAHKTTPITRPVPYDPAPMNNPAPTRDSGTAGSTFEHTTGFPLPPPAIPSDPPSFPIPSDLKSFMSWSDSDSDAASASDPAARRTANFKRLVKERASFRNLREGFDSALEGVKRQVHSERPSPNASYRVSANQSKNVSKTGTPMKISSPMPLTRPSSPTPRDQSSRQFASYDHPSPNVWVSASGVPQGNAVKRRSTHLANEDLSFSPSATGATTRRCSAQSASSDRSSGSGSRSRSPKRQMSQLELTRQERARQAQRLEKAREDRERKARADAKAKSKKGGRREGRIFDEKRERDGHGKKEKKSWFARLFCG